MRRPLLARLTAVLIGVVATVGIATAGVRLGEPPTIEATRAVVIPADLVSAPVVPVSSGSGQQATPAAATAPTTTIAAPPAPTTTAPPTAPPSTAPPTTSPPPPPTTVAPAAPASTATTSFTACERELFDRMNAARTGRGAAPMVADARIVPVARAWSEHLATAQDLRHNPSYGSQVFAAVPEAVRAGENVGRNFGSVEQLFDAFMASPGHRDAILDSGHTHVGVGCTVDGAGQRWATINFWG